MKQTIEITFAPTGEISVEALGYKGPSCESATQAFEEALGLISKRKRKVEYHQSQKAVSQQRIGK